jgi:hypothetical protein
MMNDKRPKMGEIRIAIQAGYQDGQASQIRELKQQLKLLEWRLRESE